MRAASTRVFPCHRGPPGIFILFGAILLPLLSRLPEQVAMPFIRPIQKAFFAGQCREMLNLAEKDS